MYSEFGLALGAHPRIVDEELNSLKVAILPLPGGEFHHYGTSREMISSTLAVQNCVTDQRAIMHHKVKPHPAVFVQNAEMEFPLTADNAEVWVENSHVGKRGGVGGKQPRGQELDAAQPEHHHGSAAQRLGTECAGRGVHRRGADG